MYLPFPVPGSDPRQLICHDEAPPKGAWPISCHVCSLVPGMTVFIPLLCQCFPSLPSPPFPYLLSHLLLIASSISLFTSFLFPLPLLFLLFPYLLFPFLLFPFLILLLLLIFLSIILRHIRIFLLLSSSF